MIWVDIKKEKPKKYGIYLVAIKVSDDISYRTSWWVDMKSRPNFHCNFKKHITHWAQFPFLEKEGNSGYL